MEKITSFTVDHPDLEPGVCVSWKDAADLGMTTTFDLRMTVPDKEPVMNTAEVHMLEHLGMTFLRNYADFGARALYFSSMGCRADFYLLLRGDYEPAGIPSLLRGLFHFVMNFTDEVPGAAAHDCGNYLDINLPMAKWRARRYLEHTLSTPRPSRLRYPD